MTDPHKRWHPPRLPVLAGPEDYVIYSHKKGGVWWRANGLGYTERLEEAGLFSWPQALQICAKSILGSPETTPNTLPIRAADLDAFLQVAMNRMRAGAK